MDLIFIHYVQCSRSCGTGTQTRKVFCQTTTGHIVDEDRCEAVERPTDRRKCFEKACKLKVKLTQESVGESAKFLNVKWLTGARGKVKITLYYATSNDLSY